MVNTCVVWGCNNRSVSGDENRRFYDIPKIVKHQGKQTEELSAERRTLWLARINRSDFNPRNVILKSVQITSFQVIVLIRLYILLIYNKSKIVCLILIC